MQAVAVAQEVVALEPLRRLAEGPALHIRLEVLVQRLLEQNHGSLVVAPLVPLHRSCEGTLPWRRNAG